MKIKTTLRFILHQSGCLRSKKQTRSNAGQDIGKWEHLLTAGGSAAWCNHDGGHCGDSLKF